MKTLTKPVAISRANYQQVPKRCALQELSRGWPWETALFSWPGVPLYPVLAICYYLSAWLEEVSRFLWWLSWLSAATTRVASFTWGHSFRISFPYLDPLPRCWRTTLAPHTESSDTTRTARQDILHVELEDNPMLPSRPLSVHGHAHCLCWWLCVFPVSPSLSPFLSLTHTHNTLLTARVIASQANLYTPLAINAHFIWHVLFCPCYCLDSINYTAQWKCSFERNTTSF